MASNYPMNGSIIKMDGQEDFIFKEVMLSVEQLDAWISRNGWAGYDPYDIKGTRFFMWALRLKKNSLVKKIFRKLVLGPLVIGESAFPRIFRTLFRIRPTINAKGMGLFAKAYLNLFQVTGQDKYSQKAIYCLEWLYNNRSAGYEDPCWGYPFDWESGVVVPAYTPASVVSAAVCDAFWTAWCVTGEDRYLDTCIGICRFFVEQLNIDYIDNETICFSYTPLDSFHVHNTNLLVAELLIRVGLQINRNDWVQMGFKAANYAIKEQNEDGSLFYWGNAQNYMNPGRIDHYHSGFEMRCLYSIWKSTGIQKYQEALNRYYDFYVRHLLQIDNEFVIPKMYPDNLFPINIHSCAEGLILNATLAPVCEKAQDVMLKMFPWAKRNMQASDGHFIYMKRRLFGIEWRLPIAYIRWGQAWMLLALSQMALTMTYKKV